VPLAHCKHVAWPATLIYDPAVHWLQVDAPSVPSFTLNDPAGQAKQLSRPVTLANRPASHCTQAGCPATDMEEPRAHAMQLVGGSLTPRN